MRFITFLVLAALGFLVNLVSFPKRFFVNQSEILEINRRLDSIGRL
jgi:hypothetical protein